MTSPSELLRIAPSDFEDDNEKDEGRGSDMNSEAEDEDGPHEEVLHFKECRSYLKIQIVEMAEEEPRSAIDEEVAPEGRQMLDKISKVNRQQHLNGKVS